MYLYLFGSEIAYRQFPLRKLVILTHHGGTTCYFRSTLSTSPLNVCTRDAYFASHTNQCAAIFIPPLSNSRENVRRRFIFERCSFSALRAFVKNFTRLTPQAFCGSVSPMKYRICLSKWHAPPHSTQRLPT